MLYETEAHTMAKHTKTMTAHIHTTASSIPSVTHSTGAVVTANCVSTHSIKITHISILSTLINICKKIVEWNTNYFSSSTLLADSRQLLCTLSLSAYNILRKNTNKLTDHYS